MNILVRKPLAARATIVLAMFLGVTASGASPAPIIVAASFFSLALIALLLWDSDNPPILFLSALFQWSQVAILPISTIWRQLPLDALSAYGADMQQAAIYGLAGVTALSLGLRLGAVSRHTPLSQRLKIEAELTPFADIARFSFAWIGAGYALGALSLVAGPARELFNQASHVEYIGLFALSYWCLLRNSRLEVLAAVMTFEIIAGMMGFFAEFKWPILIFLVAALAARPRLRVFDIAVVGAAAMALVGLASFWSAIKIEYRLFMNQGTGAQIVNVPLSERLVFLSDAAAEVDERRLVYGFNRLLARHGYLEFLGLTMQHIPASMPHEDGAITLGVLRHVLTPRILFPDKPALPSDTVVMAKYTGLKNLWTENTSISIGYLGELYIDFGYAGGLLAALALGVVGGTGYRILSGRRAASAFLVAGACLMPALSFASFETAYVKEIGSFVMSAAIAFAVERAPLGRIMSPASRLGHASATSRPVATSRSPGLQSS